MADCDVKQRSTHIEVEAEVRYWEDARVDGIEDCDGNLIPGREGDLWKARINLLEGKIEGWPDVTARIHYKVCDAGEYFLTDCEGRRIARWKGSYVPSRFLCHGDRGNGDYIILTVSGSGSISEYQRPEVRPEDWIPLIPR